MSWPQNFTPPEGYAEVFAEDINNINFNRFTQRIEHARSPVEQNGVWVLPFVVKAVTEQEIADYNDRMKIRIDRLIDTAINKQLAVLSANLGYSSFNNATSYINSTVASFKADAERCITARDTLWLAALEINNKLETGELHYRDFSTAPSLKISELLPNVVDG